MFDKLYEAAPKTAGQIVEVVNKQADIEEAWLVVTSTASSSSHTPGFVSPYLAMLVGGQKRCGNGTFWMRQPKACGSGPSGLGLQLPF